ncbi:MAG: CinA family nicotinamide mononucleotide deamidase-related protein [Muribaculaceae bacterium]|nr:CinA family nicotinamide mononucleotide deamidase-related protein [Muribaculaceae bacterium]
MKYTIIAIGDELLIGQVTDTNSGWIARHLTPYGWEADCVRVISDDAQAITRAIDEAFERTDVVLMTGGLGPTKDDITKPALCGYFGGELVYDETTAANVRTVMQKRNLQVNEYTRLQAMVPTSCRVIQNQVGTAPIMWFERDGKVLVSMPGVPHETETMMEREVIPQLIKRFHRDEVILFRTFMVMGIIESELAMMLDEFERNLPQTMHLAYLPQPGLMRLRLTGISTDGETLRTHMAQRESELHKLLGKAIIADEDISLAEIVGRKLREKGLTLSTAESCTGGNIAHVITEIAGSSDYFKGTVVSYANDVKTRVLGVSQEALDSEGAVSQPVVEQMVCGVSKLLQTHCAVATSGVAGPSGGTPEKPVGTVWMAAKCGDRVVSQVKRLPGDRRRVIDRATTEVLLMLLRMLQDM